MSEVNENVVVEPKQKVSRVLLEICVFGKDKDKPKVHELNMALQEQITKHRKARHRVRVFWRINNDETSEQMKEWMIENSCCKYYVFATDGHDYSVKSDYVLGLVNKIQKLDDAIAGIKASEIVISKNKPAKEIE